MTHHTSRTRQQKEKRNRASTHIARRRGLRSHTDAACASVNSNTNQMSSWELLSYCESQPTATVGETEVSLEYTVYVIAWKFSMPVGAYGDIVVRENGRTSIPRKLHRWRPQIKIGTTSDTLLNSVHDINATVTLLARATMDMLSFRDSAWNDPPPAVFHAAWDIEGSNIAWKIDGSGTETYDDVFHHLPVQWLRVRIFESFGS